MSDPALAEFNRKLPQLQDRLAAAGLDCGPDTWLALQDLLLSLARKQRLPADPANWIPLLGPIVCSSPEQQQRFPALFQEWWTGRAAAEEAMLSSEGQRSERSFREHIERTDRRWRRYAAGTILAVATAVTAGWFFLQPPRITQREIPPVVQPPPIVTEKTSAQPPPKKVVIDDWAPPNRLPREIGLPPQWTRWLDRIGLVLSGLATLPVLIWLIGRYRRSWALTRGDGTPGDLSSRLRLRLPRPMFGGEGTFGSLQRLKASRRILTRKLDMEATVEASARNAGLFEPRYHGRRSEPRYLMLVRSRHTHDQGAALADELTARFAEQGVLVEGFRFRDDPSWLVPWTRPQQPSRSLAWLAREWPEAKLILISDTEILYSAIAGRVEPWVDQLEKWRQSEIWTRRAWLGPGPVDGGVSEWLWDRGFLVLPLTGHSMTPLSHWLNGWGQPPIAKPDLAPHSLPRCLRTLPERWLEPVPPRGEESADLLAEVQAYLEEDGWLLLRAMAAYPQIRWPLTQALDFVLHEHDGPSRRERRLGHLGRLPWIRAGRIPDYLREALLQSLEPKRLRLVRQAYGRLLDLPETHEGPGVLTLPFATPSRRKLRRLLLDLLGRSHPRPSAVDDPLFLNLLLGDRLSLLDFHLPRALAKRLPGARWRLNPWPAVGGLILAAGLALTAQFAWQRWGGTTLTDAWIARGQAERNRWTIRIAERPDTRLLATSLTETLRADGFNPAPLVENSAQPPAQHRLRYPPQAAEIAGRVSDHLRQLSYGAAVDLAPSRQMAPDEMQLDLAASYQPRATFNDRLVNGLDATRPADFSLLRDPFIAPQQAEAGEPITLSADEYRAFAQATHLEIPKEVAGQLANNNVIALNAEQAKVYADWIVTQSGPDLVTLPGGTFRMGSDESDPQAQEDERPAHDVSIQPFAIGRHEVTFDEYSRFARATGRPLPEDNGWGQGQRPVINVSWNDANAYAQWLSKQTGQGYRLPTEAEWEYAARAAAATPWFWGGNEKDADRYAWYSTNSGQRTRPVGGKRPNAYGLYDMAGNVWEWTADCYHGNYQGAPTDGSAWEDQGNCKGRVVRGGSWYLNPQLLRSALRHGYRPDGASDDLGFRVARAL